MLQNKTIFIFKVNIVLKITVEVILIINLYINKFSSFSDLFYF